MNETNELLEYFHKTADMGAKSTAYLLGFLKNKENKIKKALEDQHKEYLKFQKEIDKILKKKKLELKEAGVMANVMSYMGIKMEVLKDNSDAKMADMLTQGLTMGVLEVRKKLKALSKEADEDVVKLGKDFLKFQEDSIEKLKTFL